MQGFFNPDKNLNFASDCLPQPCVPCNGNSQLECKFHHLQVNFSSTHHCFIAYLCIVILIIIPSFVGHTFRSEFLLLTKCQKTAFESRRPSRDTVITLHHCEQVTCLFWCYSCWTIAGDMIPSIYDSQEQTTGLERALTDAEEKAKMLEIV